MEKKRVADSYTEQVQIVRPEHLNTRGTLYGGKFMEWLDTVAGVVTRRHTGSPVATVCVDSMDFIGPANLKDYIVMCGKITYTGHSSMEVNIKTYVETYGGVRKLINNAYFLEVSLDDEGNSKEVPGLILETEEERREWDAAIERNKIRKQRKASLLKGLD